MKLENNWKYKSLLSLQKITNFTPDKNPPSKLIERCEKLLCVPVNQYTVEDLRLMIGQGFGLEYLVPLAIEKLEEDLFVEGDLFEGDLLSNVLKIEPIFWKENRNLQQEVSDLIGPKKSKIAEAGILILLFESSL